MLAAAFVALAAGGATAASAQGGPPPVFTAVHGDTVSLFVTQPPRRHGGFVVYRTGPDGVESRRNGVVRPPASPAEFVARLGSVADRLMDRLNVDGEVALYRRIDGDPFTAYAVGLLYPRAAEALGRVYTDVGVESVATYSYRIVYLDAAGEETNEVRTATVQTSPREVPMPTGLAVDEHPYRVTLRWDYPPHSGEPADAVFAFQVERATGGGGFQRVNIQPVPRNDAGGPEWVDRDVQSGTRYRYRVQPVDFTGAVGPASGVVTARAGDRSPPKPPLDVVTTPEEGRVTVDWRVSPQPRVVGYHVERSGGLSEPFTRLTDTLVPVDRPTYVDRAVVGAQQYFYRVVAVDTAGVESTASNPIGAVPTDTTPPAAPGGLELATEDRTLRVAWSPSSSADVTGYYVFRGETPDRLVRVTDSPVDDTMFVDSGVPEEGGLHPGREYHVSVLAVDRSGNASPGVRDSITVPDNVPPEAPTALQATSHHGRWVQLRWSASPTRDVARYALRRWSAGSMAPGGSGTVPGGDDAPDTLGVATGAGSDTVSIGERSASVEYALRDTTVRTGTRYVYALVAIDSAGNASPAALDTLGFADPTPPPAPRHVSVRRTDAGVEVRWERVVSRDLAGYRVYRSAIPTGVYEPVSALIPAEAQRRFVDRDGDGTAYYRVRAVDRSGNRSAPTDPRRAPGEGS